MKNTDKTETTEIYEIIKKNVEGLQGRSPVIWQNNDLYLEPRIVLHFDNDIKELSYQVVLDTLIEDFILNESTDLKGILSHIIETHNFERDYEIKYDDVVEDIPDCIKEYYNL